MSTSTKTSSRLVKKQANQLLKKTFIFGSLSVFGALAFVFVVIPNFFAIMSFFTGNDPVPVDEFAYVQPPTLQPLAKATTEQELTLEGFADANNQVIIILNGVEATRQDTNEDGAFSVLVQLTEGNNAISAYQITPAGIESEVGKTYNIIFDTQNPVIAVTSPEDGASLVGKENQSITITGSMNEEGTVWINNSRVFLDSDLVFSHVLNLQEGDNQITIRGEDLAGNTTEVIRKVTYRK